MTAGRPRMLAVLGLAASLALGGSARAQESGAAVADTWVLIITGVSGEAHYGTQFHQWALGLADALRERHGVDADNIRYLGERTERAPARIAARSTRENVEKELAALAGRVRPGDRVLIALFGHGSATNDAARFNLPGPDLTAREWAALLDRFRGATVAFVNAASASGDFVGALSGDGRIVITATKSGFERNETRFGAFFVDAFAKDVADVDKDGRTSLLEAYDYARREVAREYEGKGALLTEHAQLDDNGDGSGTAAPDGQAGDGALARGFTLNSSAKALAGASPRLRALHAEKQGIEASLDTLRRRKDQLPAAEYERMLETLLVALAEKNAEIRALEGKTP